MNYISIKNLVDTDRLIIKAIRIWIRCMFYGQISLPTHTTLFNNYNFQKTVLHFDDFMGCIALK